MNARKEKDWGKKMTNVKHTQPLSPFSPPTLPPQAPTLLLLRPTQRLQRPHQLQSQPLQPQPLLSRLRSQRPILLSHRSVHQSQAATTIQLFASHIFNHRLFLEAAARRFEAGEGGGAGCEDAGLLETATGCEVGGLEVTHCSSWGKRRNGAVSRG